LNSRRLFGVPVGFAYKHFGGFGELLAIKFGLDEKICKAGLQISPIGYGSVFAFHSIAICAPAIAVAIFLVILMKLHYYWLIIPGALPIAVIIIFLLYPKLKADSRRSALLAELPFIATYAGILSLAGLPLYRAFERLSNQSVFPAARREGMLILREKLFFSKEPTLALETVAIKHPLKEFRDYITSYLRILRTGGDSLSYLMDYSSKAVEWIRNALKSYAENAKLYGDLMIALFVFIPLGIFSIFSLMAPDQGLQFMKFYCFAVAPMSALGLIVAIDSEQFKLPQSCEKYVFTALKCLGVSIVAAIIARMYYFNLEFHEVLSIIIIASLVPPAIQYEVDSRKQLKIERALPKFLRDVAEARKVGLSIEKAVSEAASRSYGQPLDDLIKRINYMLRFSFTPIDQALEHAIREVKSWFGKAILWLFKEALITGGGSAETFTVLAKFSEDYIEVKSKVSRELRAYCVIGYVTSLILLFVIVQLINYGIVPQVQLASKLPEIYSLNLNIISRELLNQLVSISFTTIVVVSSLIGLVVGKISSGSIVGGFKHSAICTFIALIGIKGVGYFW